MVAKQCNKCGIVKESAEFYRDRAMRDGLMNCCKPCWKVRVKAYTATHPEVAKRAQRRFYERHPNYVADRALEYRAKNPEKVKAACDRFRKMNPEKVAASAERYRAAYPERRAAELEVLYAINAGRIQRQPCWECGARAEAHHSSYALEMRLVVTWLCRKHHQRLHREARRTQAITKSALSATTVTVDRTGVLKSVPK